MSVIGGFMLGLQMLVPGARVWALSRERAEMLEHIALTEKALGEARAEAREWRARYQAMVEGAHACQHQAQLSRALSQRGVAYNRALADVQQECGLALHDCNMHRCEQRTSQHG